MTWLYILKYVNVIIDNTHSITSISNIWIWRCGNRGALKEMEMDKGPVVLIINLKRLDHIQPPQIKNVKRFETEYSLLNTKQNCIMVINLAGDGSIKQRRTIEIHHEKNVFGS